jgi:hypothetical protein
MYAKANQKLGSVLRDYVTSKCGQLFPDGYDQVSDRHGEFSLYGGSKIPYGVLEIEVMPFTTRKTMSSEEAAERLSGLISYISKD